MSSCKQCGADVPENAPSCPTCGAPVGDPVIPQNPAQNATSSSAQPAEQPKKPRKGLTILALIVGIFILIMAVSACSSSCSSGPYNTYGQPKDWPTGSLAQMIPSMDRKCKYVSENKDSLTIDVTERINKNEYDSYVSKCKERGFTVDAEEEAEKYQAYNAEGYKLDVDFTTYNGNEISIHLYAPKVNGTLSWPTVGLATKIPNPGKEKGSIANDSSSSFSAYVGEMDKAAYDAYVAKCIAAGFDVDYSKHEKSFSAKNSQGDSLSLRYEGFNTMYVSVNAPRDEDDSSWGSSSSSSSSSSSISSSSSGSSAASSGSSSTPSASFKKAMDDYESAMDGYIAFMKKYNSSSNTASMASDYAKQMKKYTDAVESFEKIDEDSLSAADAKYYTEVQTRVSKKLLDASL